MHAIPRCCVQWIEYTWNLLGGQHAPYVEFSTCSRLTRQVIISSDQRAAQPNTLSDFPKPNSPLQLDHLKQTAQRLEEADGGPKSLKFNFG